MGWRERVQQFTAGEQAALDSDRLARKDFTRRVVSGLQIERKLTEIRDELWGIGQLSHYERNDGSEVHTSLEASQFVYIPEDYKTDHDGHGYFVSACVEVQTRAQIDVEVGICPLSWDEWAVERFGYAQVSRQAEVIMNSRRAIWNNKRKNLGYGEYLAWVRVPAGSQGSTLQQQEQTIFFVKGAICSQDIARLDLDLIKDCARNSREYPLTLGYQRDRQLIMDKLASGELKPDRIPDIYRDDFI